LGRNPDKKVMMVSHTTDLAVDFGRKVRNLISTPEYQKIFPTVKLAVDSKSAGRWNTSAGGEYYACGIGSSIAGRGAHLLLIDDPHSEQDVLSGNFDVFDRAYEWFTYGARTRLMPGGRVAIVQTRWHLDDLTGRVVRDMAQNEQADQYEIVEFPAILEVTKETTKKKKGKKVTETQVIEKPLWPEFFNLDALARTKASMPLFQWNAQYQQNPTAEEAALIKREWWKEWKEERPPECEYLIMSLDAAAETHNRADYTAITTWGVFKNEEENCYCIILLNAVKKRVEFPELKKLAQEEYDEWQPDAFIVEKKSNGTPLYQELRRTGMMVQEYTPHRGSGDKTARLNSVADIVSSGLCWVPQTRWAEELVEEVAGFPFMPHDDLVDTTVMALMRFRQGGFISLPTDEPEDQIFFKGHRGGGYY
jgi:predicted phage terminase large subunit-like protein